MNRTAASGASDGREDLDARLRRRRGARRARGRAALDREATRRLAEALFPDEQLEPAGEGSLVRTNPPDDELLIGLRRLNLA